MKKYTIIPLFIFTLLLSGCSTQEQVNTPMTNLNLEKSPEDDFLNEFQDELEVKKQSDPFGGYNRVMTKFNDGVYEYFLLPVSNGYKELTNEDVRESVSNFLDNLLFPVRFVNNLLQGKFENAKEEFGRFFINTTFGVVGLFDPAGNEFKLKGHPEDFGQTLGYWGVGTGPHIVLPFLGPSNLRDIIGTYPDSLINPIEYHGDRNYNLLNNKLESFGTKIFDRVNDTAIKDQYGIIRKDAIDLYPYLKNSYEQYRIQEIKE